MEICIARNRNKHFLSQNLYRLSKCPKISFKDPFLMSEEIAWEIGNPSGAGPLVVQRSGRSEDSWLEGRDRCPVPQRKRVWGAAPHVKTPGPKPALVPAAQPFLSLPICPPRACFFRPLSVLLLGKGHGKPICTRVWQVCHLLSNKAYGVVLITKAYRSPDFCVGFSNFYLLATNEFMLKSVSTDSLWLTGTGGRRRTDGRLEW